MYVLVPSLRVSPMLPLPPPSSSILKAPRISLRPKTTLSIQNWAPGEVDLQVKRLGNIFCLAHSPSQTKPLDNHHQHDPSYHPFLDYFPLISLSLLCFTFTCGLGPLPWVLSNEVNITTTWSLPITKHYHCEYTKSMRDRRPLQALFCCYCCSRLVAWLVLICMCY